MQRFSRIIHTCWRWFFFYIPYFWMSETLGSTVDVLKQIQSYLVPRNRQFFEFSVHGWPFCPFSGEVARESSIRIDSAPKPQRNFALWPKWHKDWTSTALQCTGSECCGCRVFVLAPSMLFDVFFVLFWLAHFALVAPRMIFVCVVMQGLSVLPNDSSAILPNFRQWSHISCTYISFVVCLFRERNEYGCVGFDCSDLIQREEKGGWLCSEFQRDRDKQHANTNTSVVGHI